MWHLGRMSAANLPGFQALCCRGFAARYKADQHACLTRLKARGLDGLLGLGDEGEVAGFVTWLPLDVTLAAIAGSGFHLPCLWVRPGLEGRGLGRALLEGAKKAIGERAGLIAVAWNDPEHLPIPFFIRHGFIERERHGPLRLVQWGGDTPARWELPPDPPAAAGRYLARTNGLCPYNIYALESLDGVLAAMGLDPPLVLNGEADAAGRWRSLEIRVSLDGEELFDHPLAPEEIAARVRSSR